MVKVAILCHYPPSRFQAAGITFTPAKIQAELNRRAFETVEGSFLDSLCTFPDLEISVVTFSKGVQARQTVKLAENCQLTVIPPPRLSGMPVAWLPRLGIMRSATKQLRPDVVLGLRNLEGYGLFAIFCECPSIVIPEEFFSGIPCPVYFRPVMWIGALTERICLRLAPNVVAISGHVERTLRKMTKAKIYRIPNIAEKAFFTLQRDIPGTEILYVGRISPEKGLLELLYALAPIQMEFAGSTIRIIGGATGPAGESYLQSCQRYAEEHLPSLQVVFAGWKDGAEIALLHRKARMLVMPSHARYETMGVVIAEALAAGTPVIGYNFGPIPDIVTDGENGLLVRVGDIPALTEAIRLLCSDEALWTKLSSAARESAERFSSAKVGSALHNALCEVAKGRN
ncbi:MAG TPA: glycosyltransferase family 4 protein [Chthoniobacterales bacterium]|jgi:glycosyltransferase involved in cell wall biosynthesis